MLKPKVKDFSFNKKELTRQALQKKHPFSKPIDFEKG
jgi:hypothetical protein